MATLGELTTAISKRLLDTSNVAVSTSDVAAAINDAVRHWKTKRFWFNESELTVTFLTSDEIDLDEDPTNSYTVTLPSDFLVELQRGGLTVTDSGEVFVLKKLTPMVFDELGITGSTGRPEYYTYRNGAIEVKPYPDRQYTGSLQYLKEYTPFLTDGTEDSLDNDFLVEGESLIRSEALARLHEEIRQDEKMSMIYTNRAMVEYNNLLSLSRKKSGSGSLTVYC